LKKSNNAKIKLMSTKLGLKENLTQFVLLIFVNAFVGSMVGLERTLLPILAKDKFGISSSMAIFSFIAAFGASKALANYITGKLANRLGRKNLLVLGWILALPVPFLLFYAPSWSFVVLANVLLGIHQGFAWSSTVVMKIDLVGEKDRGFAMGLNEFAGYVAVALTAFGSGFLAQKYEVLDVIFYAGLFISVVGLLLSLIWVRDTRKHVAAEATVSCREKLSHVFKDTTWRNKNLSSVTQAGLVNNLNDGMVWGLLPLLLQQKGFSLTEIGFVAGLYPFIWGVSQIFTGKWSDIVSKKQLLVFGMLLQSVGIVGFLMADSLGQYALCSVLLGFGTAAVYPVFLSTVAENTHPDQRAESIGIFRLWRDLGYLFGALLTGLLSDWVGSGIAIAAVATLTAFSALVIQVRMTDLKPCEAAMPISMAEFFKNIMNKWNTGTHSPNLFKAMHNI
jgi:MFS family permease